MIKYKLEVDEIIVYCDYSESCKNLDQEEMQSEYFGYTRFSIFSVCVYCKAVGKLEKIGEDWTLYHLNQFAQSTLSTTVTCNFQYFSIKFNFLIRATTLFCRLGKLYWWCHS